MTHDFGDNIYSMSKHFQGIPSNTVVHNSMVMNTMHLNYYPIPEECSSNEQIPIDPKEWWIFDNTTQKSRPPRQNEFLLLLLENPMYSSYISWTDESQGLCKIHQPHQVATLWGKVKSRQTTGTMNYEIFARGIRFYYKSGLMIKTNKKHLLRFRLPLHAISI